MYPPSKLVRDLLKGGNDAELCIKTGQTDMLKHMYKTGYYQLRYKPSFNICNRNRYIIRDASMWNDYISLLSYFHKDLHNAKYVCPKNLKAEHDRLLRKKNEIEARQRRERDRIKAIQKRKAAQGGYSIILQPDGKILRHGNQRRRHSHPSA